MRKIIYYVASSLDGFISGPNDDISGFIQSGDGVDAYLTDLSNYDTVIMGRNTYEFGYQYGLKPGQPAYPHMKHYIFSDNLSFDDPESKVEVKRLDVREIDNIKKQEGTDIYLCGGGQFAGWLLENEKIDILKLKLNPLILGEGVKLFVHSSKKYKLQLLESKDYDNGMQIMTFQIKYGDD